MAKKKKKSVKRGSEASQFGREIVMLAVIVVSILALLSLFDLCGVVGTVICALLFGLFGATAYVFPIYLPIAAGLYLSNTGNVELKRKILYSAGLYICFCGIFQWVVNSKAANVFDVYEICSSEHIGGGLFGGLLSQLLTLALGRAGSFVIILALTILFIMLLTRKMMFSALRDLYAEKRGEREQAEDRRTSRNRGAVPRDNAGRKMNVYTFEKEEKGQREKPEKRKRRASKKMEEVVGEPAGKSDRQPEISIIRGGGLASGENRTPVYQEELDTKFGRENGQETVANEESTRVVKGKKTRKKGAAATPAEQPGIQQEVHNIGEEARKSQTEAADYKFPSLDLLTRPKAGAKGQSDSELISTASKLQETLESFGVRVKMGDVSCGPSVTRYELVPEQGVKVNSITRLADDIKLSLAASDIRIEAPIPGKAAVGIEVPNDTRMMVTLRELLESKEFQSAKSNVTFAVGKDIGGKTIVTDIARMPHLLVAGATGSGKSVCINTLIMSILYKASPSDVKFIMVDPKMVELTAYADIPHLMIPVVTDPKKASAALNWAVQEMTVRYNQFAEMGVRDIKSYNKKIAGLKHNEDSTYEKMCQIVIIVDEFADLMMVAPGEVEDAVCRLAQLARAAGIHLVLATQRPSVNVITGLIKANIPSRIALSVSSTIDSRTIIDSGGAEKLLGNGDMLFAPQDYPKPVRIQGAFVSDEERDGVVSFLKQQSAPSYNEEITRHIEANPIGNKGASVGGADGGSGKDELFVEAGRFIIEKDKASIGMLQRVFRIGFNRAARIMDQLSDAGVVGPEEGTKPRTVLMSMEQFENYLEGGEQAN